MVHGAGKGMSWDLRPAESKRENGGEEGRKESRTDKELRQVFPSPAWGGYSQVVTEVKVQGENASGLHPDP